MFKHSIDNVIEFSLIFRSFFKFYKYVTEIILTFCCRILFYLYPNCIPSKTNGSVYIKQIDRYYLNVNREDDFICKC